jgi:hypothetical protein
VLIGAGFLLISKLRNTEKFIQLNHLLPVLCLTLFLILHDLSPLEAYPNKASVTLVIFLETAMVRITLRSHFPLCALSTAMYQHDCAVGVVYRGSLVHVECMTDADEIAS